MKRISIVLGLLCSALTVVAQDPWVYRDHPKWDNTWNKRPMPRARSIWLSNSALRFISSFCISLADLYS